VLLKLAQSSGRSPELQKKKRFTAQVHIFLALLNFCALAAFLQPPQTIRATLTLLKTANACRRKRKQRVCSEQWMQRMYQLFTNVFTCCFHLQGAYKVGTITQHPPSCRRRVKASLRVMPAAHHMVGCMKPAARFYNEVEVVTLRQDRRASGPRG
jgi:hypothetical protein